MDNEDFRGLPPSLLLLLLHKSGQALALPMAFVERKKRVAVWHSQIQKVYAAQGHKVAFYKDNAVILGPDENRPETLVVSHIYCDRAGVNRVLRCRQFEAPREAFALFRKWSKFYLNHRRAAKWWYVPIRRNYDRRSTR